MAHLNDRSADIDFSQRSGNGNARISGISIVNDSRDPGSGIRSGDDITITSQIEILKQPVARMEYAIAIYSSSGVNLLHLSTDTSGVVVCGDGPSAEIKCRLPRLPLRGGTYTLNLFLSSSGEVLDWVRNACRLVVEDGDYYRTGKLPPSSHSPFLFPAEWEIS
jgi:lipopolysaccharide transport system ATP-binding protein